KWIALEEKLITAFIDKVIAFKDAVIHWIEMLVITNIAKILYLRQEIIKHAVALATGFINALTGLPGKMLALGEQLIKNLAQGINNARSSVVNALKNVPGIGGIVGGLNSVIPHFATGGTMGQSGLALVGERGPEMVYLPAGAHVSPGYSGGGSGGYGGNGAPIVVQVNIDGRKAAQAILPHLTPAIRNATGRRNF